MVWKPHVTVAAIVQQKNRFLLVEEESDGRIVINQPAGHLEEGETLVEAVKRETVEETAWNFEPSGIVGIHLWKHPQNSTTFLRVSFCGTCCNHDPDQPLDSGILRTLWLSREELVERDSQLRSPLVVDCIDDYLAGARYPLDLLKSLLPQGMHS